MKGYCSGQSGRRTRSGFALVVALSLMAFILLLLLSISTLVRVEAGSADVQRKESQARQNSLMALKVALGQLQKHAGPDQRVTARADIDPNAEPTKQNWIGVFDTTAGATATAWLVSQQDEEQVLANIELDDAVRMQRLVDGLDDGNDIFADRLPITKDGSESGHMAYFIDDENLKAHVAVHADDPDSSAFEERAGRSIVPIPDSLARVLGDETITTETADKLASVQSLSNLAGAIDLNEFSRDYTLFSKGVLCDVKNGGLKRDLTIAFEESVVFNRAFSGQQNLLLTEERRGGLNFPFGYANWSILQDYYNLYRRINGDGTFNEYTRSDGVALVDVPFGSNGDVIHDWGGPHDIPHAYHNMSPVLSVLARMQFTFWVEYRETAPASGEYFPRLHLRPLIGLYNPYNVPLRLYRPTWAQRNIPITYIQLDGNTRYGHNIRSETPGTSVMIYRLEGDLPVLDPGEIIYMSFVDSDVLDAGSARELTTDEATILNASRYIDWDGVGDNNSADVKVTLDGTNSVNARIEHSFHLHRYDLITAAIPGISSIGRIKQRLYNYINYDPITVASQPYSGKVIDAGLTTLSTSVLESEQKTIGVWLRTSRESYQKLRSLADGNLRFILGDGRWDQVEGIESMSPFTGSEQDAVVDTRGETGDHLPQRSIDGKNIWGGSIDDQLTGSSEVVLFDVPRSPLVSLGQLQHANVARFNYEPTYVIGNSYANVRIPMNAISGTLSDNLTLGQSLSDDFELYDISYLTNEAIWDSYFFSTIPEDLSAADFSLLKDDQTRLPNARNQLVIPEELELSVDESSLRETSEEDGAFEGNAGLFMVDGAFNVNSTSIDAWKAVLSSLANQELPRYNLETGRFDRWEEEESIRFSRFSSPLGDDYSTDDESDSFWNGYRTLSEDQVSALAAAIVDQVKARGPFLSMADFVNRRLDNGELGQSGALQAALDDDDVAINSAIGEDFQRSASLSNATQNERLSGNQGAAFSGFLTQGDILQALGPIFTPRSDTFRIRAYGDTVDPLSGELTARVWCEAIVQRTSRPVGLASLDQVSDLVAENPEFGRQFEIVHFRWLTEDEI